MRNTQCLFIHTFQLDLKDIGERHLPDGVSKNKASVVSTVSHHHESSIL